jgi:hypothetical protein
MTKEEIELVRDFMKGLDDMWIGGRLMMFRQCLGCGAEVDEGCGELPPMIHDSNCQWIKIQEILKDCEVSLQA